jgi:pimeloyl-ACP methyl ester carboxylesterase
VTTSAARVERFEYGGAVLVDEVLGRAPSRHLVLLHGWGVNRDALRGIAVLFEHTHQVHLIDLPGFGDAPLPPADWGTVHYADLVQQFVLDRLDGTVVVVGHSFGGRVAVRLGARRLAPIKGIVLMGVPGLPQPSTSKRALRARGIRGLRKVLVALKPLLGNGPVEWHTRTYGSRDYLAAGELKSVFVRVVTEDLTESARTIACPVLLLYGTDDTETPPWLAVRYQALIGKPATLVLLPHKDHYLYTGTGAHLVAQKIRDWLPESGDV